MKLSSDSTTRTVLRMIGEEELIRIDEYVDDLLTKDYISFSNENDVFKYFNELLNQVSQEDCKYLRYYTGIDYNQINSLLRGYWDYEKSGILTNEKKQEYLNLANKIKEIIDSINNVSLLDNFKTYRGINISSLRRYGVNNINDVLNLKGQYLYDKAFTSTSLIRNNSFFNKELEYHSPCNVEIEYLFPKENVEGFPLITNDTSYSNIQSEFLINSGSLVKVVDVQIIDNNAYMKVVYIPHKIWDNSKVISNCKSK